MSSGEHRHRSLNDDRAVVELGGHEMHGAAVHAHAGLERAAVRVQPGKSRQQRRMDVEEPAGIALRRKPAVSMRMKPASTTRSGRVRVDLGGERGVEGFARSRYAR